MGTVKMRRRSPHPPKTPRISSGAPHTGRRALTNTRRRAGRLIQAARPHFFAPRWLPGLAVPHGAAVAAVPGATAG
jgi:hypothetical protein